ncbi:MAG: sigma-70 family RNA polymerase sigma factor [Planctomycetota bacterium]|jgi:RNA polymerase sigma-70 factor (ECF subfamily)|nr:sigma-70 family RNA polymerase sigma factor [Planctomycetota bacterium]
MSAVLDHELAERSRQGDREAWEVLARRYAPRLAGYLGARLRRPEIVEMLVSEALYAAWRKIDELDDPADFAAWLRRIGANLALRWHGKHKHERLHGGFPEERCGGDAELISGMQRLEYCIGKLHEGERMALEQRFRGGLSGDNLAEALHRSPEEAEGLIDKALARLAAFYYEPGIETGSGPVVIEPPGGLDE